MNNESVRYAIWVYVGGDMGDAGWDLNFTTDDLKAANRYYKSFHWDDKQRPLHKRLTIILKSNDDYRQQSDR